jgi:vitamin B12 transporter
MRSPVPLAAALLALPALARAQQPTDTVELAPVVITPSRRPTDVGRVTQATTVITGDELRARGIEFIAEALRDVPGASVVQVGSYGGVTSLFLRGGNSNYVKVLVDGVPVNQAGGAYDFADLTTSNVDRIEIVRGPASVVYGSDAVTGVVQIFTRHGGPARGSVTAEAGTYGTTVMDATAATGGTRLAASGGLQRLDTDGTYAFTSHYRNATAGGRVDLAPDTLSDVAISARYTDRAYHFPTDGSGAATDSNQVTSGHQASLGLDAGRRLSHVIEARLALALHTGRDAFDDQPDGPADTTGFAFSSTRRTTAWRRSVDARVIATPRSGLALTAGAQLEGEHEAQTGSTSSNFGFGPSTAPDSFTRARTTRAAYLQAAAQLLGGAALDAGVRLDDNSAFGTFVTGRGGLSVHLGDTRLRVSAGNAFKAPTFSENFAASPFEVGNPALRPERTVSWDAGVEQLLPGRRASLSATWFDQRFRNLVQYTPADPGEPTYANLAAASARGLELGARLWWNAGSLSAEYTWLRTRVTDAGVGTSPVFQAGSPLIRRPAHSARLGLELRPAARIRTLANLVITGRRDDVDFRPFPAERVTLPTVATLELAGDIDLVEAHGGHPGLGVRLRVENLLDRKYETIVGFPGRRRNVLVGVRAGL